MEKNSIFVNQYCIEKSLPIISAYASYANKGKQVFLKYFPDRPFTKSECHAIFYNGGKSIHNELIKIAASQKKEFKSKFPMLNSEADVPDLHEIEQNLHGFRSVLSRYMGEAAVSTVYADLELLDFPADEKPVDFSERGQKILTAHFSYPDEPKYKRIIEICENILRDIEAGRQWLAEHHREIPLDYQQLIGSFVWHENDKYFMNPLLFEMVKDSK
jgi:hypothetical protein